MFQSNLPLPSAQFEQRYARPSFRVIPGQGRRVAVFLNGNAKRVSANVRQAVTKLVAEDDVFLTSSLDEAAKTARAIVDRRYDLVLVGGGDGTVVAAMNLLLRAADQASSGLYRPPLPDLGVLRFGTGNAVAASLGAGRPFDELLRVVSGEAPLARPLPMVEDLAEESIYPFGSLGYDAQLLNDYLSATEGVESVVGTKVMKSVAGYFYALLTRTLPRELKNDAPNVRVVSTGRASMIDPETEEEVPLANQALLFSGPARCVSWGSTPYYGYKLKIFPYAGRRSDRFHLRISTAPIPYLLARLPTLWNGTLKTPHFKDFLVEGFRVESENDLPYQIAGDGQGYRKNLEIALSSRTFRFLDRAGQN